MELSIIIIEYNCMDQVSECVASIKKHLNDIDLECLVVSNSEYSDEELARYQNDIAGIKIINTGANLGYAGGVNNGLKHASGRYIYVVNPDCLLVDDGVKSIIAQMDDDDRWAIAGPVVVDEAKAIQPSCRRFPRLWTFLLVRSFFSRIPGARHEYDRYMMTDYDRTTIRNVDWVSGGATLIKASALPVIGGMDERYFLYMEDVDWCRSAWNNGYRVAYCPKSTVVHAGQHQSIKVGINVLKNTHMRWHLTSLFQYFVKYRFREKPCSEIYRRCVRMT